MSSPQPLAPVLGSFSICASSTPDVGSARGLVPVTFAHLLHNFSFLVELQRGEALGPSLQYILKNCDQAVVNLINEFYPNSLVLFRKLLGNNSINDNRIDWSEASVTISEYDKLFFIHMALKNLSTQTERLEEVVFTFISENEKAPLDEYTKRTIAKWMDMFLLGTEEERIVFMYHYANPESQAACSSASQSDGDLTCHPVNQLEKLYANLEAVRTQWRIIEEAMKLMYLGKVKAMNAMQEGVFALEGQRNTLLQNKQDVDDALPDSAAEVDDPSSDLVLNLTAEIDRKVNEMQDLQRDIDGDSEKLEQIKKYFLDAIDQLELPIALLLSQEGTGASSLSPAREEFSLSSPRTVITPTFGNDDQNWHETCEASHNFSPSAPNIECLVEEADFLDFLDRFNKEFSDRSVSYPDSPLVSSSSGQESGCSGDHLRTSSPHHKIDP